MRIRRENPKSSQRICIYALLFCLFGQRFMEAGLICMAMAADDSATVRPFAKSLLRSFSFAGLIRADRKRDKVQIL